LQQVADPEGGYRGNSQQNIGWDEQLPILAVGEENHQGCHTAQGDQADHQPITDPDEGI
jgi:hypothetical protein